MFTIGQLASKVGVKADTIRYYETIGLIGLPIRSSNSYRQYNVNDLKKLQLIRQAKNVGFSLKEIKKLLEIKQNSQNSCNKVQIELQFKITLVKQKIEELRRIKKILKTLLIRCEAKNDSANYCQVLEMFEKIDSDLSRIR